MLIRQLITEDSSWPLWATIIANGLEKGHKFYFSSGVNRIVRIKQDRVAGSDFFILFLEHVKRKSGGEPAKQTYTVWPKVYDSLTLKKFEDGHRLLFRSNEALAEAVDEPLVVSMFRKLLAQGKDVWFVSRSGKRTELGRMKTGPSMSGAPGWWFYPLRRDGAAVVWKTGDNINNLTLTKVTTGPGAPYWALHDRDVKLTEDLEEPMVVRLINQRIAKGGAVQVDVPVLPVGRRLKGWVTTPIEPVPELRFLGQPTMTQYKLVTNSHPSGAKGKVLHLTADADQHYTLKVTVDGSGNKVLKLGARSEAT